VRKLSLLKEIPPVGYWYVGISQQYVLNMPIILQNSFFRCILRSSQFPRLWTLELD